MHKNSQKQVASERGISTGSSSNQEEVKATFQHQAGPGQQMNSHIGSIPKVPVREPKSNSHA